ncbi:arrestin domain containing 2-like [Saccoglossus kowalevskii]|uniref:Arrestin domain containing 2-like n=1 Tax=Saccoglossus kowalevskii TaxID=10224 RepID=A0ABM0GGX9_SACKO|nr:arrestin domain containing 2-like [Saccoglossus kowalevskii]
MGKLKAFYVTFDGNREVYHAGNVVSGLVVVDLAEPLTCRGVRATFTGVAYVHWTESEGSGDHRRTVSYSAKQVYFEEVVTLWGKQAGDRQGDNPTLPAGVHQMPFRLQLPNTGLPASFEGKSYGYVRYSIKSNIDRPWKFDHNTKRAFTVTGFPVDLNRVPNAMVPLREEDEKTVCCWCCASGPIAMTATADRAAYTPGERIIVSMDLNNNSSRKIHTTEAALVQHVLYTAYRRGHGRAHHRQATEKVVVLQGQGCGKYDKTDWRNQIIQIPPVPLSGLEGVHFIDIQYLVEFEADVASTPFDLSVKLPITIGSVPLQQLYGFAGNRPPIAPPPGQGFAPPGSQFAPPGVPLTQSETIPMGNVGGTAPSAPPMPPPSYELLYSGGQSIKDAEDNDYTYGELDFAPRYTYYNWDAQEQTTRYS